MNQNVKQISIGICLLFLFLTAVSFGQEQTQTRAPAEQAELPEAPVIFNHREVFKVRSGFRGLNPRIRAEETTRRIQNVAEDYTIRPESITTVDGDFWTEIAVDERPILFLLDSETKGTGKTRQQLAEEWSVKIRSAIVQYRAEHSRKRLVLGSIYALLTTLVFVVIVVAILKIYEKILAGVQHGLRRKYGTVLEDARAKRVWNSILAVLNFVRLIVIVVLSLAYLQIVFSFLPWTRLFGGRVMGYVLTPLSSLGRGFVAQLPNLFFLAVLSFVTYYSLKLIRVFFDLIEAERISMRGFDPEWSKPTYNIIRVLVIAFAIVVAFPYLPGSESPAFKGVSVFIGVLFSLGSSSAVANVIAGLSLNYRKAFRVDDLVAIGEIMGVVTSIRLTVTHVRTAKNEMITIPNSHIMGASVVNYSSMARTTGLILHSSVTIGYDTPWRQVHAMLVEAAQRTPALLQDPPPFVLQRALRDFYVEYELNAYTKDLTSPLMTYSILHQNILDVFNEYGVQIMSPNYIADPESPKIVPEDQWFLAPARKQEKPKDS